MTAKLQNIHNWAELARQAKWSVTALARQCGVSVRTLERHFLETRGQKPKTWMGALRQKQALELLCDGSTIKETMSLLGYRQAGHFSRGFKAYHGYRPTERCNHCGQAGTCLKQGGRSLGCQ